MKTMRFNLKRPACVHQQNIMASRSLPYTLFNISVLSFPISKRSWIQLQLQHARCEHFFVRYECPEVCVHFVYYIYITSNLKWRDTNFYLKNSVHCFFFQNYSSSTIKDWFFISQSWDMEIVKGFTWTCRRVVYMALFIKKGLRIVDVWEKIGKELRVK